MRRLANTLGRRVAAAMATTATMVHVVPKDDKPKLPLLSTRSFMTASDVLDPKDGNTALDSQNGSIVQIVIDSFIQIFDGDLGVSSNTAYCMDAEGEKALNTLLGNTVTSVSGRPGSNSAVVILQLSQNQLDPVGKALAERTEALEKQRANAAKTALVVREATQQKTEQLQAEHALIQQQEANADQSLDVQHRTIERSLEQRDIDGYNLVKARNEKKNGPAKSNQQASDDYKRNMPARKRARTSGAAQPTSPPSGPQGGAPRASRVKDPRFARQRHHGVHTEFHPGTMIPKSRTVVVDDEQQAN